MIGPYQHTTARSIMRTPTYIQTLHQLRARVEAPNMGCSMGLPTLAESAALAARDASGNQFCVVSDLYLQTWVIPEILTLCEWSVLRAPKKRQLAALAELLQAPNCGCVFTHPTTEEKQALAARERAGRDKFAVLSIHHVQTHIIDVLKGII